MNIELIEHYFLLFLIYSFLGWLAETVFCLIIDKKLVNRGFLIGPVCPIYGIGAVVITILLTKYSEDYFAIFGLSAILCGVLEYFTSFIMEKLFNARWWDYTEHKFNINGRICLDNLVLFGLAGVFTIEISNPLVTKYIDLTIRNSYGNYLVIFFGLILLIDFVTSLNIMSRIKSISSNVKAQVKDNTEEMKNKVKEIISEKSLPYRRIIQAFPNAFASKIKEGTQKIKDTAQKVRKRTIKTVQKAKLKTLENVRTAKEKTNFRISKILKSIQGAKITIISKKGKK